MKLIKEFEREETIVRMVPYVIVECEMCGSQEEKKKNYWKHKPNRVCKKCSRLKGLGIWKGKQINHENIDPLFLLELLEHDFNLMSNGDFINKVSRGGSAKKGQVAGRIGKKGYREISVYGKRYTAHRLVWLWYNKYLPVEIDHKNQVKTDNRISNLRECLNGENQRNIPLQSNNTTGFTGVIKEGNKFITQIRIKGKTIRLGSFNTFEEAKQKRIEANIKYGFNKNHGKEK